MRRKHATGSRFRGCVFSLNERSRDGELEKRGLAARNQRHARQWVCTQHRTCSATSALSCTLRRSACSIDACNDALGEVARDAAAVVPSQYPLHLPPGQRASQSDNGTEHKAVAAHACSEALAARKHRSTPLRQRKATSEVSFNSWRATARQGGVDSQTTRGRAAAVSAADAPGAATCGSQRQSSNTFGMRACVCRTVACRKSAGSLPRARCFHLETVQRVAHAFKRADASAVRDKNVILPHRRVPNAGAGGTRRLGGAADD